MLERGYLQTATNETAFERTRRSHLFDGLAVTPIDTARMLLSTLEDEPRAERAARIQAGLAALDPKLLEPPISSAAQKRLRERATAGDVFDRAAELGCRKSAWRVDSRVRGYMNFRRLNARTS